MTSAERRSTFGGSLRSLALAETPDFEDESGAHFGAVPPLYVGPQRAAEHARPVRPPGCALSDAESRLSTCGSSARDSNWDRHLAHSDTAARVSEHARECALALRSAALGAFDPGAPPPPLQSQDWFAAESRRTMAVPTNTEFAGSHASPPPLGPPERAKATQPGTPWHRPPD